MLASGLPVNYDLHSCSLPSWATRTLGSQVQIPLEKYRVIVLQSPEIPEGRMNNPVHEYELFYIVQVEALLHSGPPYKEPAKCLIIHCVGVNYEQDSPEFLIRDCWRIKSWF
jgi:hypothetical protein